MCWGGLRDNAIFPIRFPVVLSLLLNIFEQQKDSRYRSQELYVCLGGTRTYLLDLWFLPCPDQNIVLVAFLCLLLLMLDFCFVWSYCWLFTVCYFFKYLLLFVLLLQYRTLLLFYNIEHCSLPYCCLKFLKRWVVVASPLLIYCILLLYYLSIIISLYLIQTICSNLCNGMTVW